jgi:hypothetical protein
MERVLVVSLGPTSLEPMVFGSIDLSLSLFINFLFGPEVTFEFDNVFVIVGCLYESVFGIGGFGCACDHYLLVLFFVFVSRAMLPEVLFLFAQLLLFLLEVLLELFLESGAGFDQRLFFFLRQYFLLVLHH